MRKWLIAGLVLAAADAPVGASQKFITGLFTATESGAPIELIAWAQTTNAGTFRMENGSLEDAPILPRTYKFLVNLGSYDVIGVLATTTEVMSKPLDRMERRDLPFSTVKLAVTTNEIGVPELEHWDRVQRLRKSLRASAQHPLIFFLIVTNGANVRYYPFFIDRT